MSIATILVPDFTLILIGFLLMRFTRWGEEFWSGLEKMVYFVLFPVLLFYSTARTPLDLHATGKQQQKTQTATNTTKTQNRQTKPMVKPGPMVCESGVQTAFRFNSY